MPVRHLQKLLPTVADLSGAPVDVVAGHILRGLAHSEKQGTAELNNHNFALAVKSAYGDAGARPAAEAWAWLHHRGLICDALATSWFWVTREGHRALASPDFATWVAHREFPDSLIHEQLRGDCLSLFRQGKFDTAVFEAFKTLEVAVRDAAQLGDDFIGTRLVAKAFNPEDGSLTDRAAEAGERQALMNLMSGAIGSYKNPQSHRRVGVESSEAREMIVLASHLLKIVDSRRPT